MKRFLQNKCNATYYNGDVLTLDIHKDYIEYYQRLSSGHIVLNVEVFSDGVRISAVLGNFWDDFFNNVLTKTGINPEENPLLDKLLGADSPYKLVTRDEGKGRYATIMRQTDTEYQDFLQALASKEIRGILDETADFVLGLFQELAKSQDPAIRHLAVHFYD